MPIPDLHPFQRDLVEKIVASVAAGNRIIAVQLATGGGKTTVMCHLAKRASAKGKTSLFLVHRRRLVDQISGRLEEFETDHGIIMRGERTRAAALVQVASRDTIVSRCFTHEWRGLPGAQVIFNDEAHHAIPEDSEYRRILSNYPEAVILLFSATPVAPDGQGPGPWAHDLVCAAPTSALVASGFLVPVKCYAPDRKRGRGGKYKRGVAGDLVESWKTYAEGLPTVLFCSRVQHSRDAVLAFQEAGISAAHVDADTSDYDRDRWYEGLGDGSVQVVSNVGIVKEGVDIPCLGCCQIYMEMSGRVAFLQACGRIMRPFPGKSHAVLIDHAGAVFRHGFPDEDTDWTLSGNVDELYRKKHDGELTPRVYYCKACELLYHDRLSCPECGKVPSKPPRSIFAPPPLETTSELLIEAEREGGAGVFAREVKVQHWLRCLAVAANRNGTFGMASQMYRRKYAEWPPRDFPCVQGPGGHVRKVADVYPKFRKKRA